MSTPFCCENAQYVDIAGKLTDRMKIYRSFDISLNDLEDTDLAHLPSMEEVLVMREDDVAFTEEMHEFLATLSDTQRRRLELRALRGKSQTEIAEIEHIGQPGIHKSFVQISQKFKNFIENGASEGEKNAIFSY